MASTVAFCCPIASACVVAANAAAAAVVVVLSVALVGVLADYNVDDDANPTTI